MNKKTASLIGISTSLYLSVVFPAYANNVPNFGTCLNPQWSETQVNYGSDHGVINVGSFPGTDTIYESNGNVMQCLCTDSGNGYQTNWLKASDLSQDEIANLQAQGWIYVPYGDDWGLDKGPYLAQNSTYACTTCTPTPTPSETVTPTTTPTPGPSATPTPGTQVGAASANNLANTGSALLIYGTLIAGAASLILGMILRKLSK